MKTLNKIISVFIITVMVAIGIVFLPFATPTTVVLADGEEGVMTVHFIDCGQADACVIEFPDDKTMLIDAGHTSSDSYGAVKTYVNELGITKFDYFIMTHADADHIGGVTKVFESITADVVYRPSQLSSASGYTDPALSKTGKYGIPYDTSDVPSNNKQSSQAYKNALECVYEMTNEVYVIDPSNDEINEIEGSVTVSGQSFEYSLNMYSPLTPPYSDNNDYSPIMVLSYAGRNLVIAGDAEEKNEKEFVQKVKNTSTDSRYDIFRSGNFHADLIKMSHHGSSTSSSEDYLNIMTQVSSKRCNTYTLFSCNDEAYGNKYAHPHNETLDRLMDMGFSAERIERTDLNGNIRFDVRSGGELTRTHDKDATITELLTSGTSDTRAEKVSVDNNVKPTEPNGSPVTKADPDKEGFSFEKIFAYFMSLDLPIKILIIAGAVLVLIAIIAIIVAITKKGKRKKSRRRR